MKTAIINYESGNLFSVFHACENAELNPYFAQNRQELDDADLIILPGVGAFGAAMNVLQSKGLDEALIRNFKTGKPMIGICRGMQLFLSSSEEIGQHKGLDFIPGQVKSLRTALGDQSRVPHVGWNKILFQPDHVQHKSLLDADQAYMYFVHSFYAQPDHDEHVLAYSEYQGFSFVSVIGKDNVLGMQFHPERSGSIGLQLYHCLKDLL